MLIFVTRPIAVTLIGAGLAVIAWSLLAGRGGEGVLAAVLVFGLMPHVADA